MGLVESRLCLLTYELVGASSFFANVHFQLYYLTNHQLCVGQGVGGQLVGGLPVSVASSSGLGGRGNLLVQGVEVLSLGMEWKLLRLFC